MTGPRPPTRAEYDAARERIARATSRDVERALGTGKLGLEELAALLSPAADAYLEEMAALAQASTLARFGRVVGLYIPLYVSNHCVNRCRYCGFNAGNGIPRKALSLREVAEEAETIARLGHRSILLVSGESERFSPVSYLIDCVAILSKHFRTVHVEVAALEAADYHALAAAGAEGMTMYQETYDAELYADYHPAGPKKNFSYRWEAPLRALAGGLRGVTIGPLLGLAPLETELYWGAVHLSALRSMDPSAELGFSFPRMRPHGGEDFRYRAVGDRELLRGMLAMRLFAPWAGISVSTRERAGLRDALVGVVATRLSAGSRTTVGGYTDGGRPPAPIPSENTGQFSIDDERSIEEIVSMLRAKGLRPISSDWDHRFQAPGAEGQSA